MKLKPEQIKKFFEIHKDCEGFNHYSEEELSDIANGVANYYINLFKIHQNNRKKPYKSSSIIDSS